MKKVFISAVLMMAISLCGAAQTMGNKLNPDAFAGEFRVNVGMVVPNGYSHGSDVSLGIDYNRYIGMHTGYRIGAQMTPEFMDAGPAVGFPLQFVYRTRNRDMAAAAETGVFYAASDYIWSRGRRSVGDEILNVLLSLFSRAEVFAGITPGFIIGDGDSYNLEDPVNGRLDEPLHGTKVTNNFSTTLDLGLGWSYRIRRCYLTLSPAVHYSLFRNYEVFSMQNYGYSVTPVRLHFSFNASLGYAF